MCLNRGAGEDSWESPLDSKIKPVKTKGNQPWIFIGRTDNWNSNTLATWCEELTHLERPWCWERLRVRGEGANRGLDGWMSSLTQWTWVWVNSGSRWWTGRPGMLWFMGSQRVGHDWATELNWTIISLFEELAPVIKNPPASAGDITDWSSIPGLGRCPGKGKGYPLQYSSLENSLDRGAWRTLAHGVSKRWTWLKQLSIHAPIHSTCDLVSPYYTIVWRSVKYSRKHSKSHKSPLCYRLLWLP